MKITQFTKNHKLEKSLKITLFTIITKNHKIEKSLKITQFTKFTKNTKFTKMTKIENYKSKKKKNITKLKITKNHKIH